MLIEIIHFATVLASGLLIFNDYNFLLKMLTIDSLFNALHFSYLFFINNNLTESQIVNDSTTLYYGTSLDRYIYYIGLYLLYKSVIYFFWLQESFIYSYILLFTIIPFIINIILASKAFDTIRKRKEIFIKTVIAKILVSMVKHCGKVYLEKEDISIKHEEIMEILKDYKETVNYFFTVLKSLGIIVVLSYVKNYAPSAYYGIIKYIYNYKTGELLASYNGDSAKKLLTDILENKKWYELTKPNTFKAIIFLYQLNADNVDIFGKLINDFNFILIKSLSIWSFSSLLASIYVSPGLSLIFLLYSRYVRRGNSNFIGNLVIILLSFIIGYFYPSYLLITLISQFGPAIIFNQGTYIVIRLVYRNIKYFAEEIIKNNKDITISFGIISLYILLLKTINVSKHVLIGINVGANILMGLSPKKQVIFGTLLLSTYNSDYRLEHLLFNSVILYLILGYLPTIFINTYTIQDLLRLALDINVRQYYREAIRYVRGRKNVGQDAIAFRLLDTKKYPSISQMGQQIVRQSDLQDSISVDDPIFNKSTDNFINEISIDVSDDSSYTVKLADTDITVINNFLG
ncbi:MAG: hypothetical protein Barrevirus9_17 [Barrevirus sp.]|uniref:Uncharacterized protein n=1 Tax=Barrevirus sp. TaxID=2487763 RepID=A0A3G4ZQ68_9VIRU|nr:MAG: hypothetical protein Barrevirus9_17 [Barrevirus sp.]